SLPHTGVSEVVQRSDECLAGKIARRFHAAITSSWTKWRWMVLGFGRDRTAIDGIADHFVECFDRVGFGDNAFAKRMGRVAAFFRVLDNKCEFVLHTDSTESAVQKIRRLLG